MPRFNGSLFVVCTDHAALEWLAQSFSYSRVTIHSSTSRKEDLLCGTLHLWAWSPQVLKRRVRYDSRLLSSQCCTCRSWCFGHKTVFRNLQPCPRSPSLHLLNQKIRPDSFESNQLVFPSFRRQAVSSSFKNFDSGGNESCLLGPARPVDDLKRSLRIFSRYSVKSEHRSIQQQQHKLHPQSRAKAVYERIKFWKETKWN